jgi:nitrite reductase (NO-forming)
MKRIKGILSITLALFGGLAMLASGVRAEEKIEDAVLTFAPEVPPAIARRKPAVVRVELNTEEKEDVMMTGLEEDTKYVFWTFNGKVPGPFIRVRVGDTLELKITNPKNSGMPHNVDFHAVTGPGGGAKVTLVGPGETKVARFKMLNPGLYVYHCAAPPVTEHIANGMYGLILVEPENGLPKVDREFYVMQGDFYTKNEFGTEGLQSFSAEKAESEQPTYVVFNGRVGALQAERALKAKTGERVRFFFGNGGPNLVSSWHIIGEIFENVYHEGSLENPLHNVQTTLVPAGGSTIAEFKLEVPGDFTLVDHSIFRIQKGCVGTLHVEGPEAPEIYKAVQ